MAVFLALGLIIGGLAVAFVFQNAEPVTVSVLLWQQSASLSVVLMVALAAGFAVALCLILPSLVKAKWQVRVLMKRNKKLEEDLMIYDPTPSKVTEPAPVDREDVVDIDEEAK